MLDFSRRSTQKELMDFAENYSDELMARTYREINFINKYLLGDYFILRDVARMARASGRRELTVIDLGCGNGDLLRKIQHHLGSKGYTITAVGYDPYLSTTGGTADEAHALYLYDDWAQLTAAHTIDITVTSLTLHHLYGEELAEALQRLQATPRIGFVISDLVRSKVAYYIIKVLTALFSRSILVKNDACLSVWRGFSRTDMMAMTPTAPDVSCTLNANIAFRWMLIGYRKP